jgi:hypothetical protein
MKGRSIRFIELPGFLMGLAVISYLCCGHADDHERIRKKTMPDLHYAYADFDSATQNIDEAIARVMELYALDPRVFGDPVGIIATFSDSLSLLPGSRRTALIVVDQDWEPPPGIISETITGAKALIYDCRCQYDSLDLCWRELADFAHRHNYICVPPGIEIYRGFGTETVTDISRAQLIIRID